MDTVEFRWLTDNGRYSVRNLDVLVNGTPLAETIAEVERPSAARSGQPDLAGTYSGIPDYYLRKLTVRDHFLGAPGSDLACGSEEKTVLLACECGEPGCWPLMARVIVAVDTVTWSEFEQPYREAWDYGGFTLTFDRQQYENALDAVPDHPSQPETERS